MEVLLAIIAVLVAIGVGIAVAWPLLRPRASSDDATPADRRERLEEQLETSLRAIREIEQDHLAGGLSDEDFETLNRDERARAVALIRRIDALDGAGSGAEKAASVASTVEEGDRPPGPSRPRPEGAPTAPSEAPSADGDERAGTGGPGS